MPAAKIGISLHHATLRQVDRLVRTRAYRSRSEAIQHALEEKLARLAQSRLAEECRKLSPAEERALADCGLETDAAEWPAY